MVSPAEFVVLLDRHARPIGRECKSAVHHEATPLHLAFSVFLFDDRGRALFQQRALNKVTWPGVWSNTCCGHPAPDESLIDAAHRRLHHELGIEPIELTVALPDFRYRARWGSIWENEVCPVLVGRFDGSVRLNPTEVAAVRWINWSDFAATCVNEQPSEFATFSPWSRLEARQLPPQPWLSTTATPVICAA